MVGTSTYFRIVVSYLVILVVPMVTLTAIGYSMVSRAGYRETLRHNTELVHRVQAAVDREIAHMTAIAFAIDRDFEIRHPRAFGDPLDVMSIQRRFGSYVATNQFIQDVIYATRGAERYIGATSVFSPTGMLFAYARRDVIDGYRFNQTLESVRRPGFILLRETIEVDGPFAFYAHPIGLRTDRPAVVLFVIPTPRMFGVVAGVPFPTSLPMTSSGSRAGSITEAGHFVVTDPYGTVVMLHPPVDRQVLDVVRSRRLGVSAPRIEQTGAGRFIVTSTTSPESGWSTALITPVETVTSDMRDELRGLLIVVVVLILVEIVLLEFFIRWNYRPVSVLLRDLEHPGRPNDVRDGSLPTELSTIHHALQDAHRSNERSRMTDRLFHMIGHGPGYNPVTAADLLERLGMPNAGEYRAIVVRPVSLPHAAAVPEDAAVATFTEHFTAIGRFDTEHSRLTILVAEPEEPIQRTCELCFAGLCVAFGAPVRIGLGPKTLRLDGLATSLDGASEAAERALLRGDVSIVEWTRVDSTREAIAIAELTSLVNASQEDILRGGVEEACGAVRRILGTTIADIGIRLTSVGARAVAHGVLHQLISRTTRPAAALFDGASVPVVAAAIGLAGPIDAGLISLDELNVRIDDILGRTVTFEAAVRARAQPSESHRSRVTELVDYVNSHLLEQSFSLTRVASTLGMSVSSASSLFKDRVGQRLTEYVGDRRVAEAKRLLDEGRSVAEVVEQVGYHDSTSFIKKFKKSTGLTPGEWHRR